MLSTQHLPDEPHTRGAQMPSMTDVFLQVCAHPHEPPLIADNSHKNVKTALKYLASAYGTTPEKLAFTSDIEAGYREQLRAYFDEHPKGQSTIRNTLQYLAQLWKAFHTIDRTPPVPRQAPKVPGFEVSRQRLNDQSPYRHLRWLQRAGGYWIAPEQWPKDISTQWDAFAALYAHDARWVTFELARKAFGYYVSYQLLSPTDRLAAMPEEAQTKLQTGKYAGWLREITTPPIVVSWDELFELSRLNSYLTWSSWRCWRWHDEILKEREPHRPSMRGKQVAVILRKIAKRIDHQRWAELDRLCDKLQDPPKMHDKKDPMHRFELSELEEVACALMAEARRMNTNPHGRNDPYRKHLGRGQALRFQLGLILQLAWRNPMRARNWCEALRGHNLKQDQQGQWRWRFEGTEMKISHRGRGKEINVFEADVPPDVAVHLDEFLSIYRPLLKNAATDRHVFLSNKGAQMTTQGLLLQLKVHVSRHTGKRLYTHLLRSLFSTYHLTHGMDINSVAYAMNDTPQSVLKAYNQLQAETHRPIIADANQRALANGHKPLTPPVIPVTPKRLKPMDPDQMNLI